MPCTGLDPIIAIRFSYERWKNWRQSLKNYGKPPCLAFIDIQNCVTSLNQKTNKIVFDSMCNMTKIVKVPFSYQVMKPHKQNHISEEEEVQPEEKLPAYQKDVWLAPIVPFLQSEHFLNATMVCVCILQHRLTWCKLGMYSKALWCTVFGSIRNSL